jgi:hypothetical protein
MGPDKRLYRIIPFCIKCAKHAHYVDMDTLDCYCIDCAFEIATKQHIKKALLSKDYPKVIEGE